ncbi:MAG: beta-ketoacyl-ACP synthase II [Clostridiales bacterium]|jgi:3-oxoacyl-[acyl-carrier-protein] synthase II|nr:beta-ketoacyl-ACP synthase II [Clostridiales bacterium]
MGITNTSRRVVVTGMGVVSPIGKSIQSFWDSLINGISGIGELKRFDTTDYKVKIAAEVKDFDPSDIIDIAEQRRNDLYSQFAIVAAHQAVMDSKIALNVDPHRFGVYMGSGIGGIKTLIDQHSVLLQSGPRRVSPYLVPMMIANIASGTIAIRHNAKGPNFAIVTACATSTHSIGEAFRTIKHGYADAMIAGGAEAPINELSVAGFTNCMALSTNSDFKTACRPFDKLRNGFIIGEGGAALVLEEYNHAKSRGAKILVEVVGYANTCDAFHITAPEPNAVCISNAITQVIKQSDIERKHKIYLNAHGTSTPLNDKIETFAIKSAFGQSASDLFVSSTKSMHGHMLGATGAVEAIACVKALTDGTLPPTINYNHVDPECDLNYIPNKSIVQKVDFAMSNSLGFGGHNAVIAFKKL